MGHLTDRDLTAAEARAEIEAFLGSEWTVITPERDGTEDAGEECYVSAWSGAVGLHEFRPTYRAVVDALKAAWRDAVRPWVGNGVCITLDSLYLDTLTTEAAKPTDAHAAPIISRVLGEEA